ncbi:MAG: HNH endonuclease [Luteimonas sp.]
MSGFDKSLLHFFVRDSLRSFSESFYPGLGDNPFRFSLNGRKYSVHISFVHDSGASRDNDDETRIQISRSQIEIQRARHGAGERVAFVGFFSDGEVFVGWDPRHVFSLNAKTVVSIYARQSMHKAVQDFNAATHDFQSRYLGRASRAIALQKSALGFYLENIERFHDLDSEAQIVGVLEAVEGGLLASDRNVEDQVGVPHGRVRDKFELLRVAYKRNPRFRTQVLEAYEHRCCVCGIQLALVQAAHIIPHALPECTDEVINGLALCSNHHRLYDDGLLLPHSGGVLRVNEARAKYLSDTGRDAGLDGVRAFHGLSIRKPRRQDQYPSEAYLEKGVAVRLG